MIFKTKQCEDAGGMTSLHWAARMGNDIVVRRILGESPMAAQVRSYPNRQPGGWTPLMSVMEVDCKTVQLLHAKWCVEQLASRLLGIAAGQFEFVLLPNASQVRP